MKITSYYIDDSNTMHTYSGNYKHITISDVKNEKIAEKLIKELFYTLRNLQFLSDLLLNF